MLDIRILQCCESFINEAIHFQISSTILELQHSKTK